MESHRIEIKRTSEIYMGNKILNYLKKSKPMK
jgi:hypothetical protein